MKSDSKKVEEGLKMSEEQFIILFNKIAIGIAICELILDQDGNPKDYRFCKVNPAFEEQTGLKISTIIGKTVKEIYPDIEQSWIEKFGSVVIDKKSTHFFEFNHNTNKYFKVNAFLFSENKFTMCLEDITQKKKTEDNLKKSEKEYQQLFNSMNELFLVIELIYNEDGNAIDYYYHQVNPAFEKFVNKKKVELIGRRATEIFGVVEDYWIKAYEKVAKTGNTESFENYRAELDKYYSINVWKLGGKVGIIFSDVTKIKKSELALNESLKNNKKYIQRLKDAQRIAKIGNWEWNTMTNKVEWSDTMYNILGYKPNSVQPSYELALKHVHADDKERYETELSKAVSNKSEYYFENKVVKINNSIISVISRGVCFLDENNNLIRMVGTVQDITNQKLLEKKLSENQKLSAMGEMASSIAHDFNNALQSMLGNLDIINFKNNLSDSNLARLKSVRSTITDAASRVKALQSFGQEVDANKGQSLDLNLIIEESITQSRPLWKDKMEKEGLIVKIITDYGDIPKMKGNKGELKSALHNLIKNCIEAMPEGGTIRIETGVKNKVLFMTIADTGIGMDEKTKQKIFQPFYTTKGFEAGRGLGMSGVYSIVKKYGGDIEIKFSELGKGTTIEIIFPIQVDNQVEQQDELSSSNENKQVNKICYNVLWVEDDVMLSDSFREIVELIGHNCDIVTSGKSALNYLKKGNYDIVITDIGMPDMNGWQLSDAIKKQFGDKIKVVVASGWDIDEKTKLEHGVEVTMQKPISMEELTSFFESLQVP